MPGYFLMQATFARVKVQVGGDHIGGFFDIDIDILLSRIDFLRSLFCTTSFFWGNPNPPLFPANKVEEEETVRAASEQQGGIRRASRRGRR